MSKNSAFLLLLPEASTDSFRDFIRKFLFEQEIDIEEEGIVCKDELIRQSWVVKCYPLICMYSALNGNELNARMSNNAGSDAPSTTRNQQSDRHMESIKSRFFSMYHELWDTVVEEGRLLSAREGMIHFGDISPEAMAHKWWSSFEYDHAPKDMYSIPGQLIPGCHIARLYGECSREYYVVNGFFPAFADRWTAGPRLDSAEHSVTWLALSWNPSSHSLESVKRDIFGVLDPSSAEEGSLRRVLYTDYTDFGICRRPCLECNGFDVFLHPLEALAQQCTWSRRRLTGIPFGRQLLQEGLPSLFITRVLSNPLMVSSGRVFSIFEWLEGMPNAKVVRYLSELYRSLREDEKVAAERNVSSSKTENEESHGPPTSVASGTPPTEVSSSRTVVYEPLQTKTFQPFSLVEGCEEEEDRYRQNSAVVFIKPHAYNKLVFAAVTEILGQQVPDLSFDHICDVDAHLIETRHLVDRQYGLLSFYAMTCDPTTLLLSDSAEQEFAETFHVRWKDVVGSGRLWNAKTAMSLLGQWSPKGLYDLWVETPKKVSLTSGAYVCQVPVEGGETYIINGFYPYVREMFTAPGASVRCYMISWPEKKLSWKAFLTNVIGCTNPANAPETSVRGYIFHHWRALKLSFPLDVTSNGVHASAGPVEAMVERHLWFGTPYDSDVLMQRALRRGFSGATLLHWAINPAVTVQGDEVTEGFAFDVLSNRNTSEVVEMMRADESMEDAPKAGGEHCSPVLHSATLTTASTVPTMRIVDNGTSLHVARTPPTALNRGVVFLHPVGTTQRTVLLVKEMLQRAGVVITAQLDVFANEATEAILDTPAMRSVAHYSSLSGEELWNVASGAAQERFEAVFHCAWQDSMDDVMGADVVLRRFPLLTPYELMLCTAEVPPTLTVKLDRQLYVSYWKKESVYVINGFYPFLRETYTSPGSFLHLFEVAWREEDWTWKDFNEVVIGDRDVNASKMGTLQRMISDNWKDFGLYRRPAHRAGCCISASQGPLEAVVDRLYWFTPKMQRSKKVLEDPVVQELLRARVPLEHILYLLEGYKNLSGYASFEKEKALLRQLSTNQQTSRAVSLICEHSKNLQDVLSLENGFIYLPSSSTTERTKDELLAFLAAHSIKVMESGIIPISEVIERQLLNPPSSPLFRSGLSRKASEIPLTSTEKQIFHEYFRMTWDTAVKLSLILNSAQHVARVGEMAATEAWEAASQKVRLSSSLYVAYIEPEGLYVMNGFFSFLLPRLHSGHAVFWCSVTWETEVWHYDDFLKNVIGDEDPTLAVSGSFRHVLQENWEEWGLSMPLDALENGIYACQSPMEALSERCRWLLRLPEDDFFGRQLLQSGVHVRFLDDVIQNPVAHLKGDLIEQCADIFGFLPQRWCCLCESLLALQRSYELTLLPYDTIITSPRPAALLAIDEDHLWDDRHVEVNAEGKAMERSEEEVKDMENQRLVTLTLRRGISTAYAYKTPLEAEIPMSERQWWLNGGDSPLIRTASHLGASPQNSSAVQESYAILSVFPAYLSTVGQVAAATLLALLKDFLFSHHVKVWIERDVSAFEAEARHVYEAQFDRLHRYSTKISGKESISKELLKQFADSAGVEISSEVQIFNALELASAFNLTARKVERLWEKCTHPARLSPDLFVASIPKEDMLLVNGFGLQFQEDFSRPDTLKHFLLISWDSSQLSYQKLLDEVIGCSYLPLAKATSFHGVLRDRWQMYGLNKAPPTFTGVVSASESALHAMKHRQAWLGIGLLADPLGRETLISGMVSPVVLRRALQNPATPPLFPSSHNILTHMERHNGPEKVGKNQSQVRLQTKIPLLDHLFGAENSETLAWLQQLEHLYREEPTRNTAFALVKPHALCKRFAKRIEHVFKKHAITIDEEGDITGEEVHRRGLVRYLYPAAAGYAVRPPASLKLTDEEQHRVYSALKITWKEFILSSTVLNAYEALKTLGDITPRQLYLLWLTAGRHRVMVRPDLEITKLPDQDIFVINAYFPALKQSFEVPNVLLHWYVISWPEKDLSWKDFNTDVVGSVDPSNAKKGSIRGHLYHHWRDYGLNSLPDRIQNGIHVSLGPLQGLAERITFLEHSLAEDPLGEMMMRLDIHPGLLESWLDNPDITVHDNTAGVFEHMTEIATSRLLQTLVFLSDDVRARERGENCTSTECVEDSYLLEVGSVEEGNEGKVAQEESSDEQVAEEEKMNMSWRSDLPWTEEPIVYRNTAVLIIKPHVSHSSGVRALLLDVLKEHKVRVLSEEERESSTWLLDRLCFSKAFYAMCPQLAEVLANREEELSKSSQRQFRDVFGERWMNVLGSQHPHEDAGEENKDKEEKVENPSIDPPLNSSSPFRLLSAFDAMNCFKLSPFALHTKCTGIPGQRTLQIGEDMEIVQVYVGRCSRPEESSVVGDAAQDELPFYVVNPSYPYYRERMTSAPERKKEDTMMTDGSEEWSRPSTMSVSQTGENAIWGVLVVCFDGREYNWHDFREEVIGDLDPSKALKSSFRGQLYQRWDVDANLKMTSCPNVIDNGVQVSTGSLQAFAERLQLFGVSDFIPDQLVRSLCMGGADHLLLADWSENPLVAYTSSYSHGEKKKEGIQPKVCRLFDLLYEVDTRDLIELVRTAEEHIQVKSAPKDLRLPDPRMENLRNSHRVAAPPPPPSLRVHSGDSADFIFTSTLQEPRSASAESEEQGVAPHPGPETHFPPTQAPVTRIRRQLNAAMICDAIVGAKEPDDIQDLWEYYLSQSSCTDGKKVSSTATAAGSGRGGEIWMRSRNNRISFFDHSLSIPTIDVELFYKDFSAVMTSFGTQSASNSAAFGKLITEVRTTHKGQMNYNQFARALALFRTI